MTAREIGEGFRIAPPPERSFSAAETLLGSGTSWSTLAVWGFVILIILVVLSLDVCSGDGGGTGSDGTRIYVGPGFGGK